MASEKHFTKGALIWINHQHDVWQPATISDKLSDNEFHIFFANGDSKIINVKDGSLKLRAMACVGDIGFNQTLETTETSDDLTKLKQLATPDVLYFLRSNYKQDKFYSKLGSGTVLALNPFKEVADMFSEKTIHFYSSASQSKLQELPSHVYASSQSALIKLKASVGRVNQSIIVSGESGAGKTWTVRSLMHYLAEIGIEHRRRISSTCSSLENITYQMNRSLPEPFDDNLNSNNNNSECNLPSACALDELNASIQVVDRIEHRILYSNPILEAFGNARTLRNQNSSRFGKYIQLQYDRTGSIVGAALKTYLLEKTRALRHDPGERSYHIFYQILHGATEEEKDKWKMPAVPFPEDEVDDRFTVNGNLPSPPIDSDESDILIGEEELKYDVKEFSDTRSSLLKIGISNENQENIFCLLSAVLHLRLLSFVGDDDDMSNVCELDTENANNETSIEIIANILGVSLDSLLKCIRLREIITRSGQNKRKSTFHRPCTIEECNTRRGCLAKFIYECLFHWIVNQIAEVICAPENKWCSFIGLLDVYGFESFTNNSLEQLCINFANEKLQQHFVSNFLREQQEEYILEGVEWSHCDLTDNIECLRSIEAPRNSLFALINEECRLNRASDHKQLCTRISLTFENNKSISLPRISSKDPNFLILHYAGSVAYNTEFLIEKNKDEIPVELLATLRESDNQFLTSLLPNEQPIITVNTVKGKSIPTVLSKFKSSLDDLLTTLAKTDCHYIRCIKPNYHSEPERFESKFVLSQLKACGVVETIRVCAPAHPNKIDYSEFFNRYRFLLNDNEKYSDDDQFNNNTKTGSTKRTGMVEKQLRQSICRRITAALPRKNGLIVDGSGDGDKRMQFGNTKVFLSSSLFEDLESSRSAAMVTCAVTIQSAWRNYRQRQKCREERKMLKERLNQAATLLQINWKRYVIKRRCRKAIRLEMARREHSTKVIQMAWRLYISRQMNRGKQKLKYAAAVKIQTVFRGWKIRWKYKDLLDAWKQLKLIKDDHVKTSKQKELKSLVQPLEKSHIHSTAYMHIKNVVLAGNSQEMMLPLMDKMKCAKVVRSKSDTVPILNNISTPPMAATYPRHHDVVPWKTSPSMFILRNIHQIAARTPMHLLQFRFEQSAQHPSDIGTKKSKRSKRYSRTPNTSLNSSISMLNLSFASDIVIHEHSILKNSHVEPLHDITADF